MRRTYDFVIDEKKYQATTFAGKKGINLFAKLMKLVGPAIIKTLVSIDKEKSTIDINAVSMAANALIVNMNSDNIDTFIDNLLESVEVIQGDKKTKADLDNYFAGEYGELFQVLFQILKENYSSFLPKGDFNLTNLMLPAKAQQ